MVCQESLLGCGKGNLGLTEVGPGEGTFAGGSTYEYPVPTGLSTKRTSKCRVHEYGFRSNVRLSVKVYGPNWRLTSHYRSYLVKQSDPTR